MEIMAKLGGIITQIVAICILLSMVIVLIDLYFTYIKYLKMKLVVKIEEILKRVKQDAISEIINFQLNNNKNNKK